MYEFERKKKQTFSYKYNTTFRYISKPNNKIQTVIKKDRNKEVQIVRNEGRNKRKLKKKKNVLTNELIN